MSNLHNFVYIEIAEAIEKNIFEIEIYIHWTIAALYNIDFVNMQWIDANHVYVTTTILKSSHIRIYDIGYTFCITLMTFRQIGG